MTRLIPSVRDMGMPCPIGYAVVAVSRAGAVMMHGAMRFLSTRYCVDFIISSAYGTVNRLSMKFNGSVTSVVPPAAWSKGRAARKRNICPTGKRYRIKNSPRRNERQGLAQCRAHVAASAQCCRGYQRQRYLLRSIGPNRDSIKCFSKDHSPPLRIFSCFMPCSLLFF